MNKYYTIQLTVKSTSPSLYTISGNGGIGSGGSLLSVCSNSF